jgi:hypothetical protein
MSRSSSDPLPQESLCQEHRTAADNNRQLWPETPNEWQHEVETLREILRSVDPSFSEEAVMLGDPHYGTPKALIRREHVSFCYTSPSERRFYDLWLEASERRWRLDALKIGG